MLENVSQAFQGIWGHKLRSFLTMLGIIIGIASIITIVSTIKGTNEQIKQNLIGSGTNAVVVQLYQGEYPYDFQYSAIPDGVPQITEETRKSLENLSSVETASLFLRREYVDNVYRKNTAFSGSLYGIDTHYFDVQGYKITFGRNFISSDLLPGSKVVILDTYAQSALFPSEDPIGQTIEIMGEPFVVIGVATQSKQFTPVINSINDYYMYANRSTGILFVPSAAWPVIYRFDEPQAVAIKATHTDSMTEAGKAVADALTESQILNKGSDFSYKSQDLLEQAKQLQELSNATNTQLIWIASISLLVGGIGVMNIMLVSVTERTREIGLKKAIGAKRRRIMWQFLTEAAVLTSLGGILGVIGGIVMATLISGILETPASISVPAILIAAIFSVVIGVIFGLIPAVKASKLNPIDALRRE